MNAENEQQQSKVDVNGLVEVGRSAQNAGAMVFVGSIIFLLFGFLVCLLNWGDFSPGVIFVLLGLPLLGVGLGWLMGTKGGTAIPLQGIICASGSCRTGLFRMHIAEDGTFTWEEESARDLQGSGKEVDMTLYVERKLTGYEVAGIRLAWHESDRDIPIVHIMKNTVLVAILNGKTISFREQGDANMFFTLLPRFEEIARNCLPGYVLRPRLHILIESEGRHNSIMYGLLGALASAGADHVKHKLAVRDFLNEETKGGDAQQGLGEFVEQRGWVVTTVFGDQLKDPRQQSEAVAQEA
jgi:hypothetical protein